MSGVINLYLSVYIQMYARRRRPILGYSIYSNNGFGRTFETEMEGEKDT